MAKKNLRLILKIPKHLGRTITIQQEVILDKHLEEIRRIYAEEVPKQIRAIDRRRREGLARVAKVWRKPTVV